MAAIATINPLNQFFALNGSPLNNGKLYFGEANKDPEQFPITMYWDEAGLVPALQPIRTTSGYPARSGSPAILYCNSKYSLRVRQSNDVQVFYLAEAGSDVESAFGQFTPSNLTPSFVNSTSFTVTGDQTAILLPKLRLRLSTTSGFVYGTILTSVYSALTTVTLRMDTGQALDAGLSSFDVSIIKPSPSALPESTRPGAGIGISYADGLPTISARVSLPINGSCQIAQQAIVAISAAYQYSHVDMHLAAVLAGTGLSGNLGQFAMTGVASGFGYGVSAGSWTTGNFNWQTRIQGAYTTRLNSRTVTVAAKVFQNTGGARNFKIALYKPTTTLDTFSAQTLLQTSANNSAPSGTTTQISATFTLGASDATLGLAILVFDADAANTVVSKSYLISDWQLKAEQSASPFDLPEFDTELALCQKYFSKTFLYATAPAQNVTPAGVDNAANFRAQTGNWGVQIRWNFPVPMRLYGTAVTITTYNPSAANSSIRDNSAASDIAVTQKDVSSNTSVNISSSASATAGNLVAVHITADCRL